MMTRPGATAKQFSDIGLSSGGSWAVEDLEDSDGAEISALTLADNAASIKVAPGTNISDACSLTLDPPGISIDLVEIYPTTG